MAPANLKRLEKLLTGRKIRVQIAGGIPTLWFQAGILPEMQKTIEEMRAAGIDVWPGFAHVSPTSVLSITKSLIFAQSNDYVWHEVVLAETHAERSACCVIRTGGRGHAKAGTHRLGITPRSKTRKTC